MKRQRKTRALRRGFTLIEVLLVLAILGIIAAMVVPQLMGTTTRANKERAKADMAAIETALKMYAVAHDDDFPQELTELTIPEPLEDGTQPKPYITKIIDPWGTPYGYMRPADQGGDGTHLNSSNGFSYLPELWSKGKSKDGDGTQEDDVNNWDERIRERNEAGQ